MLQNEDPEEWKQIHFKIFDSPAPELRHLPYKERISKIREIVKTSELVEVIPTLGRYSHVEELHKQLAIIERTGGEGLILRDELASYGAHNSILRFKGKEISVDLFPFTVDRARMKMKPWLKEMMDTTCFAKSKYILFHSY